MSMEQQLLEVFLNKETVFFGLFLYLFWLQQQEKKNLNDFLSKQQAILSDLTNSYEKMANNQERLTTRIEAIEDRMKMKGE